ncbi:hypothetical protein [Aeromonas caviae]|nr:hypothetical protein [Aeromonas caviae]
MAEDKDLERQYRKNVMVLASIVFIYSVAGGQMSTELSLFGAKLTFSRPEWLEYAMLAMLCFFWWRHCQISEETRGEHLKKVYNNFRLHGWVYKRLMCDGQKSTQVKYDSEGWDRIYGVPVNRDDECGRIELYWMRRTLFGGRIAYMDFANNTDEDPWHEREIVISPSMRLLMFIKYFRSSVVVIYRDPEFGDGVLPTIFFVLASASWVLNHFQISLLAT